jgi:alpha-beta hydrolase superfamily lysophospholipase
MPAQYQETIKPDLAGKYTYIEDGDYTKSLDIPTYQWLPVDAPPKAMVLGVHGLTLHGRRFRVLARTLAVNGIGFVSMDMRGFGRCKFDDKKQFSTPDDDKSKVNYEKSFEDIVQLAKLVKQKYPDVRLIALGESLGCTFCVRLAAEHPELLSGMVLSAPAVHLNKDMYGGEGQIRQGLKAVIRPSHELNMRGFFAELCSSREDVQNEMLDDPLIVKQLPLGALISTDEVVEKTAKWGKSTSPELAVLVLQGSADGCVSPKHVVDLMNNMKSDDQTLAWRGNFGHLQLETCFMRAATISAIADWLLDHSRDRASKVQVFQQNIADLGGTITK